MDILFTPLSKASDLTLCDQLCEKISLQISVGLLKPGQRLPSCRKIASQLNISRNTVVSAYHNLIYDGLVEARERSGYFVHELAKAHCDTSKMLIRKGTKSSSLFDVLKPNKYIESFDVITRPENWANNPYPFVCNQMDAKRFPLQNWRKCCADILSLNRASQVISDHTYNDCEELITEIQTRLLPNRGIVAARDEILLTAGAQQALYLTSMIFGNSSRTFAIEDPCYPEARNIFSLFFSKINHIKLDSEGITCDQNLKNSDMVYVTPNHQYPTSLKMSSGRRKTLLEMVKQEKIIIIEDDYDSKTDFDPQITTSLKASDNENNIIYIGSLSKNLNPGLRLGYLVASPDFVKEAKKLRGLMVRHLPPFLQLTTAKFISMGHHDAHINMLQNIYKKRWHAANDALNKYFPDCKIMSGKGGTNFIIESKHKIDFTGLVSLALNQGVVMDHLKICYSNPKDSYGLFRLGVSAISLDKINMGVKLLRKSYDEFVANTE